MKLEDLSAATQATIRSWRFDRIVEKHEGPERWESFLGWSAHEFIEVDGAHVLLPVEAENLPNITVERSFTSADGRMMTILLKDTTLATYYKEEDEWWWAGFVAICERVGAEGVFVATLYHERFLVSNPSDGPGDGEEGSPATGSAS